MSDEQISFSLIGGSGGFISKKKDELHLNDTLLYVKVIILRNKKVNCKSKSMFLQWPGEIVQLNLTKIHF